MEGLKDRIYVCYKFNLSIDRGYKTLQLKQKEFTPMDFIALEFDLVLNHIITSKVKEYSMNSQLLTKRL